QRLTTDYLNDGKFCRPDQIKEIIGCVLPHRYDSIDWQEKRLFGKHKDTLDVCFVAYKYTSTGKEKGYDIFVEAAKRIATLHPNVYFHVVGGFNFGDLDVTAIGDRIRFYGKMETDRMAAFYRNM